MAATAAKMTLDEFLEWQERPANVGKRWELVAGEAVELPSPDLYHGAICGNIIEILKAQVRYRKKGFVASNDSGVLTILDPPSFRGADVLMFAETPDLEKIKAGGKQLDLIPSLVVEVLSQSDRYGKVSSKVKEYLRAGVSLVWIVDRTSESVTVHKRGGELETSDTLDGNGILPGFECKVADFFKLEPA